MTDFIRLNGQPVRATSLRRRTVPPEGDGAPAEEAELVVMLRGRMAQQSFLTLLQAPRILVEIPEGIAFEAAVARGDVQSVGEGAAIIYRNAVSLRETAKSAAQRAAERSGSRPASSGPPPTVPGGPPDPVAPAGSPAVSGNAADAAWAATLRRMTGRAPELPAVLEDQTPNEEMTSVEARLAELRLEALIAALERAGVIGRAAVDEEYRRLLESRFGAEAANREPPLSA